MTNTIAPVRQTHLARLPLDPSAGKQPFVAETQLGPVTTAPAEQIERRRPAPVQVIDRRSGHE